MGRASYIYLGILFLVTACSQTPENHVRDGMVYFSGGEITIGSNAGNTNEYPKHNVEVKPFYLSTHPVTVSEFERFVDETGYVTQAERFGNSAVFRVQTGEWALVKGANWKTPLGSKGPKAKPRHPVTHVSWNDALAYCEWAGKRLPTEKEWEFAARNGKNVQNHYSWGGSLKENDIYKANVWQGQFPDSAAVQDGYLYTSPVGKFGETKAGLTDMGGNVWEWSSSTYRLYKGHPRSIRRDPNKKVIRGGSFLCDSEVCHGYRVSARSYNTKESATFHMGFRTAKSVTN